MIRALILALVFSGVAYGQQAMLLQGSAAAPAGILDGYTADAAYCTCWLYSAYSGSLIRVRRASDNAEQDIGRDGQGLDEAALTSFCSGTDCFVTTWYDQSGSGSSATQATAAAQPKIYDSVSGVLAVNTKPALSFEGAQYFGTSVISAQPNNYFIVSKYDNSAGLGATTVLIDGTSSRNLMDVAAGSKLRLFSGAFLTSLASITDDQSLIFALYSGASSAVGIDGGTVTTGNAGTFSISSLRIGANNTLASYLDGSIQLFVFFSSDQSANRAAIETALNNYFLIY